VGVSSGSIWHGKKLDEEWKPNRLKVKENALTSIKENSHFLLLWKHQLFQPKLSPLDD